MSKLNKIRKFLGLKNVHITHEDIASLVSDVTNLNILEAGAADGSDTLKFSKQFPNASIYAFEPVKKNYLSLSQKIKGCKNVKTFNIALSNENGEAKINVSSSIEDKINEIASASSLLSPKKHYEYHPNIIFNKVENVQVQTIDTWAKENGVDHIDVLWLDLQGLEYKVLSASDIILPTVKVLYTEVCLTELYDNSVLYEEYKSWLLSLGFSVVKEELLWDDAGNVLFYRK